ncbi:hypothetical protein FANTH_10585 [Fusarium anthophilum]|uniref:Zn(2)-C6 fungal-type domain-containing protein n=1 Tax=Fusarium anthophilum TaxID=48485 RepID=A0A8H4Z1H6_9HYPO|nr:hypothetical protein FANTH_10585 [Fusarium anthophilum]
MSTATRTRRPHTRSKTGCLTCRKRRVRCDGGKPTCTRCVSAERTCEFADPSIPLRDRKAICLPGEQQPWIISQDTQPVTLFANSPFGKSVEPFDCLGLDMTLRSRELLYYFHNSHDSADSASYGNVHDTEAHINGLINAVHLLSPLDDDFGNRSELEEELANRYLLLTYYAYQGFKARILGSDSLQNLFRQNNTAEFSTFVSQIYLWKTQNIGHLEMRLNAMKLLPFFFAALPSSTRFHNIDASPLIDCLKHVTTSTQTVREDRYKCDPSWEWIEGSDSRLLCATIGSHFSSLFHDDMFSSVHSSKYSTSWSGMCAASSLYMHSVLELWNGVEPMDAHLLRRLLCILNRDLGQSVSTLGLNDSTDFWIWRAFLGAYSIAKQKANSHGPLLDGLQRAFTGYVEAWTRVTGLALWEEAHARLVSVAWPANMNYETGRSVWINANEHTTD